MLCILYPSDVNWFYEALARDLHDDLAACDVPARLMTPQQLLGEEGAGSEAKTDVVVVNAMECTHSLAGPRRSDFFFNDCRDRLRAKLTGFERRVLLNVDGIGTKWFQGQIEHFGDVLTHIFDLCMVPQTKSATIRKWPYSWIPESFTRRSRQALVPRGHDRPIPWSVVGHVTRDRSTLVNALIGALGADGVAFLPAVRPFSGQGSQDLSAHALHRLLSHSQYYAWVSHHRFPYHEGLRALHAVAAGATPVKIDPLYSQLFADIPWVYESVEAFLGAIDRDGPLALFDRARDFLLSRGTLGSYVAQALYDRGRLVATRDDAAATICSGAHSASVAA